MRSWYGEGLLIFIWPCAPAPEVASTVTMQPPGLRDASNARQHLRTHNPWKVWPEQHELSTKKRLFRCRTHALLLCCSAFRARPDTAKTGCAGRQAGAQTCRQAAG